MPLPFDIARCAGLAHRTPCETCLRREPGAPEWQSHIAPPPVSQWKAVPVLACPQRIAPDKGC